MKFNLKIDWKKAPAQMRIEIANGKILNCGISIGWGTSDKDRCFFDFSKEENENCRLTFYIDTDNLESQTDPTTISVVDTAKPFSFKLKDALGDDPLVLADYGVETRAEEDIWANL